MTRPETHADLLEPGLEIGELTLVELTGDQHPTSGSYIWRCKCRCEREALRTAIQLRRSFRDHASPMCHECLAELGRGLFVEQRSSRHVAFLDAYEEHRDLYGGRYAEREFERIVDDVEAEGVPVRAPECLSEPLLLDESRLWEPSLDSPGADWSSFYPMRLHSKGWCDLGSHKHCEGYGCVRCLSFMCVDCVRGGGYCNCHPNDEYPQTLGQIGAEFELSCARIGQVTKRAIQKLRESSAELWAPAYEIREQGLAQVRAVDRLREALGLEPTWTRDALTQNGWRYLVSLVATLYSAPESRQTHLKFALAVADNWAAARHIMTFEQKRQRSEGTTF